MSISRRTFLEDVVAATGLVFVGCGFHGEAAQAPRAGGGVRRRITVKGRRITTVDVHAHCAIPAAAALLRRPNAASGNDGPLGLDGQTLADRIGVMDAQGIDMAVLSINPNWYDADRDLAAQVIQLQNEGLAQFCASHADRFVAFASVALQFPEVAAQQLEHGMKTMGLRGAAIGGSVAGMELADVKLHPFWAKAEELFYVDGRAMMAVPVQTATTFSAGNPIKLFDVPAVASIPPMRYYDVTRDGQKFLMIKDLPLAPQANSASIVVVLNWFEELKTRMGK